MGIRTVQVATCDNPHCSVPGRDIQITETFVDAGVYGCAFHRSCWETMTGPELAKALGLDDIKWMINQERGNKVIYSPDEPS
jgi:hypothetical protein